MGVLRSDRVSGLGGANAINGSVRFDIDGYLFVDSHSDWSLDGDFTIECWVKRDASGAFADKFTIGDSKESTGLELYLGSGGAALNVYSNNGGILVAAAGSYSANVWHHLALVRSGNTIKLMLMEQQIITLLLIQLRLVEIYILVLNFIIIQQHQIQDRHSICRTLE